MFILGTLIDSIAIIIAGLIGLSIEKALPEKLTNSIIGGIAVIAFVAGISFALKTQNLLIGLVSLTLGIIAGESLGLDDKLKSITKVEDLFDIKRKEKQSMYSAFITASLISLIGPLMILGSLENGLYGNINLLLLKTAFDVICTIALAAALGEGVLLSAFAVLVVQGTISFFASMLNGVLTVAMVSEISSVGGLILIFLSLNLLGIRQTKIVNMLPAFVFVLIVFPILSVLKLI